MQGWTTVSARRTVGGYNDGFARLRGLVNGPRLGAPGSEDPAGVRGEQFGYLAEVDAAMEASVTAAISNHLAEVDASLATFADASRAASTAGGKRLRPRFAYWAWRCAVPDTRAMQQIVGLGAALELLHAAILVHDDIIDRSELRRGGPSVRAQLAGHHRDCGWAGSSADFGDHAALLVGDLLWAAAHDQIDAAVENLDRNRRRWIVHSLRAMRAEVVSGQLLELCAQAGGDFSAESARKILQYKTSSYTVERPVELGLLVAGADPSESEALRRFARATGIAFQLRDDLRDLFAVPEDSGKRVGDDIRSGKPTEMLGTALRLASEPDRETVLEIIGRGEATDDQVVGVRAIFLACGAVAAVGERIAGLVEIAENALSGMDRGMDEHAIMALRAMMGECVDLTFLPDVAQHADVR